MKVRGSAFSFLSFFTLGSSSWRRSCHICCWVTETGLTVLFPFDCFSILWTRMIFQSKTLRTTHHLSYLLKPMTYHRAQKIHNFLLESRGSFSQPLSSPSGECSCVWPSELSSMYHLCNVRPLHFDFHHILSLLTLQFFPKITRSGSWKNYFT